MGWDETLDTHARTYMYCDEARDYVSTVVYFPMDIYIFKPDIT